ncbi:TetR-like C-terminal domain-containing protein [Phytomonospora sp. NPDC050363]|uniref:TetR-like C-terminal domain-containing protein n=1 Tax=Phytomonospora sp. NPDC050363 TaxID=3155642 RepID=UPI0033FB9E41
MPHTDDPLADIHALAAAYRHRAREHPHLYTVLFGGVQTFDPTGDPVGPLLDGIDRALAASTLTGDATSIALSIWVTLHGLVALELAGALDAATAEATLQSAIPATLRGWSTAAR